MDKAYKSDIPRHKKTLLDLKREFLRISTSTDWTKLRIEPLLKHVSALERLLLAPQFSSESARLRKGVVMFHADLVYIRANIKALKEILAAETKSTGRANKLNRPNQALQPTHMLVTDRAFARSAPSIRVADL